MRIPYLSDRDSRVLPIEQHERVGPCRAARAPSAGERSCERSCQRKRRRLDETNGRDALESRHPSRERSSRRGEDESILRSHGADDLLAAHREEPLRLELQDIPPLGRRQRRQRDAFDPQELQIDGDRNGFGLPQQRREIGDCLIGLLRIERHLHRLHAPPRPASQHNCPDMLGTDLQSDAGHSAA